MFESLKEILFSIGHSIGDVWRFRVATVDQNEITVANITIALVVFVVGLKISRKISDLLVNKILSRASLSNNARFVLKSLSFYLFIIIFILLSLDIAQIPLQIFAVAGGALAIGVGFGSQNIIKDFICGLVIMIEQPVRVGDMIEIDEKTQGKVMRIGAISTHILTFRNIDILVPNSALVEGKVTNWTLTNNRAKRTIKIGVAYGSPTRRVGELLIQAVNENERVFKDPPAQDYFINFGDNSLDFEVHYWIYMNRPGDERGIASEIRHRIVELFEKEGIVIAFPQRDIHIDSIKPLEIVVKQ